MRHSRPGRLRLLALVALASVVLAWPGAAARSSAQGAGRNFLWKVQSATGVLYLAGSVHALGSNAYPLNPAFDRAFDASPTLVEEIDLAEADALTLGPLVLDKGTFQDGRTFDRVVSAETAKLVADRLKDTPLAMGLVQPMKVWMVSLMLAALEAQKAGLDPSLGLDKHFFDKATAGGKTVVGLETAASQIDRLDRMPEALQEQMLRGTLKDLDTERGSLASLVAAWRRGDARAVEALVLAGLSAYPAAYTSLIVERNHNWLPRLDACLAARAGCFVVVGAAHLVGPDGLVALLEKKGYRVEQQ